MRKTRVLLMLLACCVTASANGLMLEFRMWGNSQTIPDKIPLFVGWFNGFSMAGARNGVGPLMDCLADIPLVQTVAMVDKYYKDHPEKWSEFLGDAFIEALTVKGSPCEGKWPTVENVK
jgi:hypothetical protein